MPRAGGCKELTMDIKGQIVGMSSCGRSIRQIGKELTLPYSTVRRTLVKFRKTGSVENEARSGRPKILSERDKNHLEIAVDRNHFSTLRDISNNIPTDASRWTVSRSLKERGVKLCAAAKKPNISTKNIKGRKDWCKDFGAWTEEEWQKVIWSDESTVELNLSSRKVSVRRKVGERYRSYCLAANNRSGRISVMFWSCFWQNELGPLVALPKGKINSNIYCQVLEEHLYPFYAAVKEVQETEPWFMDDNCKVHESWQSRDFKAELGIRTLRWPSQSPDLNPIENLWKLWKDNIQKAKPTPTNREELIEVAGKAWEELKTTSIGETLVDSIKSRIKAVKSARGHPTKY